MESLNENRISDAIWKAVLVCAAVYFLSGSEADNDLWGHLLFGKLILSSGSIPTHDPFSFSAAAREWQNHEWLAQLIFISTWELAGNAGLLILKLIIGALTVALTYSTVKSRATSGGVALRVIVMIIFAAVLSRGFSIRPQIFTYLGVTYVLYCIERIISGRTAIAWSLPIFFVFWANCHAGVAAGLGAYTLFALLQIFRKQPAQKTLLLTLILSALATLLNPQHVGLYTFIAAELSMPHPISEWQPVSLAAEHAPFILLALLTLLTLAFNRDWRVRPWEIPLILLTLAMALKHQRHTPLFALFAAAPLAFQLQEVLRRALARGRLPALGRAARTIIACGAAAIALAQLAIITLRIKDDGLEVTYDPRDYPQLALSVVRNIAALRPINLALPLEWGEYALWNLPPQVKVSLDGRFAALYSAEQVQANFDLFYGNSAQNSLLTDFRVDAIISPLDAYCAACRDDKWQRVMQDSVAILYLRKDLVTLLDLNEVSGTKIAPPERTLSTGAGYQALR